MDDRPGDVGVGAAVLTIGTLAERAGLSPATVRVWEQRYGFPVPRRLPSGHRRYTEDDLRLVREVLRRRQRGVHLEAAVEQVLAGRAAVADEDGPPSVYATLRRTHSDLAGHRLRKSTLIALSHAIEDEFCSRARRSHLFGCFQQERFYSAGARARWGELDRVSGSTYVMADFSPATVEAGTPAGGPVLVPLPDDSPLRREWAVVCDAPDLPVALTAWEIPGQLDVPDRDRQFEAVWTVLPAAVRDAARTCARAAVAVGARGAPAVATDLAEDVDDLDAGPGAAALAGLFNRVVAYVDTPSVGRPPG